VGPESITESSRQGSTYDAAGVGSLYQRSGQVFPSSTGMPVLASELSADPDV
jgi:hypothetical protein